MKLETFVSNDLTNNSALFEAINSGEEIFAKSLPFDQKVLFLKELLKYDALINPTALLNIALIILGGSLEDEVFERDDIFFESLVEFLDIKYELKSEINTFNYNLAKFIIGVLKGYSLQLDDTKIDVTNIYWNIIEVADFTQISKIFNKVQVNSDDCPPVRNAKYLLDNLCKKNAVASALARLFNQEE